MKISNMFLIPAPDASVSFVDRYAQTFRMVDFCAENGGFDGVWFTEHHFSDYGYSPNPLLLLAEASKRAPDLRLGTAICVLPLWHPLRLAEDVALLDVLSGGKVDFGVGRGYQSYEFDRLGVDMTENRDMFNESLAIIRKAWVEDDFEYKGRVWNIAPTTVFPKPLQDPHPPIWMAATTPPSIRAAVEHGFHLMTGTGGVFEELQQRNAFIDTLLVGLGRPLNSIERATNRFTFCSTSRDEIDEVIERSRVQTRVSRALSSGNPPVAGRNVGVEYVGEPDPESWRQRMIIGTPDECIDRIESLAAAGITYIHGLFEFGGIPEDMAMRSLKLFCDTVMPAMKAIDADRIDADERAANSSAYLNRPSYYQGV